MVNLNKIIMKPIMITKKNNGKYGINEECNRLKILRIIGITELKPEMYNYSDGSYNMDIIKMDDIDIN